MGASLVAENNDGIHTHSDDRPVAWAPGST